MHPSPTHLVPGPASDDQSLEMDYGSAGDHLKSRTKEFQSLQPVSQLHWDPT